MKLLFCLALLVCLICVAFPTDAESIVRVKRNEKEEDGDDGGKYKYKFKYWTVADHSLYQLKGSSMSNVEHLLNNIRKTIKSYMEELEMKVLGTGKEVWQNGDQITISTDMQTTLDNFKQYRIDNIEHGDLDFAILLTAKTFTGTDKAKFYGAASMCSNNSVAVISYQATELTTTNLITRVIAHYFGLDLTEICPECSGSCIIDSVLPTGTAKWSSCSKDKLKDLLSKLECLNATSKRPFVAAVVVFMLASIFFRLN